MTPSFAVIPTGAHQGRKRGLKEMAMFSLRKAFVDPAPRPKAPIGRMERYFGDAAMAMDFWVPE